MKKALAIVLCLASISQAAELRTLRDETFTGTVVKVTQEQVIFKDETEGDIRLPVKGLLYIKLGKTTSLAGVKYHNIELKDGSLLHCKTYEINKTQVKATLINDKQITFPLSSLAGLLHDAHDSLNLKSWQEKVLKKKQFRDIIALKREGVVNALEGTFGDVSDDGKKIAFTLTSNTKATVPFERMFGMYFIRPPDPDVKPVICKVLDTHANVYYASELQTSPSGYTLKTPAGVAVDFTADQLVNLDYSRGKLIFLSEMNPAKEVIAKVATWGNAYRRDANLAGGLMRIEGRIYERGMSIHSHTELEYDLGGEFRELKAIVGIDDQVGGSNSPVMLRILCDGKEIKTLTLSRKENNRAYPIALSVKDVQRLRIIVTRGKTENPLDSLIDTGKHLNLAELRVTK